MQEKVGILHPGEMGVSVAASALKSGFPVYWASEGRGQKTRERAESAGLVDASTLAKLCETCSVLVSVCPPHAAEEVAKNVLLRSFSGIYLDANAISPQRVIRMGEVMAEKGVAFVDGGIVGPPAWRTGTTWLYLSGKEAERAAACFAAGPLQTQVIGEAVGKASALKMCYAAYTKGTTALLCGILGAASGLGVRKELENQWSRTDPGLVERAVQQVNRSIPKAWRYVGEMEEIAATFREVGIPQGFHAAAADIYRRMAPLRDRDTSPLLEEVLAVLLQAEKRPG